VPQRNARIERALEVSRSALAKEMIKSRDARVARILKEKAAHNKSESD